MNATPEVLLQAGQKVDGFEVQRVTPLPNLRAVAYQIDHAPTGARILHLHSLDTENLFAVIFRTPPADDTGLPHILEHAVLGGSKRFPVKDPFFEMVKTSAATFINAMTASDHTMYPVASNVRRDFYNLAEVYWDAVFHPNLTEMTFQREGHHLEFADQANPDSDLIIKGIVYNEMKGAYSSPTALLGRLSFQALFPDSPYGRDSGGDPDAIPDLTYDDFVGFHRALYHPANAYIFLYGDIPPTDHLPWLSDKLAGFEPAKTKAAVPAQARWTAPRALVETYPVGPADALERKTFLTINWLIGQEPDVMEELACDVIDQVLLGHQAAPLRKAIIDSKLGEDLTHSGFFSGYLQSTFHVGIKGSEADRREAFETLVRETLEQVAAEGITPPRVDAAFQQLAYQYLEVNTLFPLKLMSHVKSKWLYGHDPLALLRAGEHLDELRRRYAADPHLFGRLIRRGLLENPHRLTATLAPDPQRGARREAAFADRMRRIRERLTERDKARIIEVTLELERQQNAPNPPEALASLPQLKTADLPARPLHIPTTVERLGDRAELLHNDVFANGVNYLQIDFDLADLREELYAFLPLYGDCVQKMGVDGQDFVRVAERIAACTGGVDFYLYVGAHGADPGRCVRRARFALKFLDDRADDALRVLEDLVFALDPRDADRLRDVLLQSRAWHRNSIAERGTRLAVLHAARDLGPEAYLANLTGGWPQMRFIEQLVEQAAGTPDDIIERLLEVGRHLAAQPFVASFTGSPGVYDRVCRRLEQWLERIPADRAAGAPLRVPAPSRASREGLAAPMDVAYCAQVLPAPPVAEPVAPLLMVGERLVGMEYVLEEVRLKGTAYGAGCKYDPASRTWGFFSYRDPGIKRTLDVFAGAADYVRRTTWSQADVDRAIIGTAKEGVRPIRPGEATGTALWRHVTGDTPERRERRYSAILTARAPAVRQALLDLFETHLASAPVCVVSSREKLERANREMAPRDLSIEDIIR